MIDDFSCGWYNRQELSSSIGHRHPDPFELDRKGWNDETNEKVIHYGQRDKSKDSTEFRA